MLLVGIDWAERHHDVCLMAAGGGVLARERIHDGVAGVGRLHELIAGHAGDPAEVVVGIETDRGLLVGALVAAGYQVVAVNPLAASRYRERHTISRAKSDRGDARIRPWWLPSAAIPAVGARWPCSAWAPTPDRGRALSHAELVTALRRAGRRRQVEARAVAIQAALVSQQLEALPVVAGPYGQVVAAAVAVIASLSEQLAGLEAALTSAFCVHRDAGIVRSQPGLGVVLAARVLAEFGDDPDRYQTVKSRKAYAGTAPSPAPRGYGRWCWPGRWGTGG